MCQFVSQFVTAACTHAHIHIHTHPHTTGNAYKGFQIPPGDAGRAWQPRRITHVPNGTWFREVGLSVKSCLLAHIYTHCTPQTSERTQAISLSLFPPLSLSSVPPQPPSPLPNLLQNVLRRREPVIFDFAEGLDAAMGWLVMQRWRDLAYLNDAVGAYPVHIEARAVPGMQY